MSEINNDHTPALSPEDTDARLKILKQQFTEISELELLAYIRVESVTNRAFDKLIGSITKSSD